MRGTGGNGQASSFSQGKRRGPQMSPRSSGLRADPFCPAGRAPMTAPRSHARMLPEGRRGEIMNRRLLCLFCVAPIVALLAATSLHAEQSPNWQRCVNKGKAFSQDVAINGCTTILQSKQETQANRAI